MWDYIKESELNDTIINIFPRHSKYSLSLTNVVSICDEHLNGFLLCDNIECTCKEIVFLT
jgi:hypothetical protein